MQQDQLFTLTDYGRRLVSENIRLAHHMAQKVRRPASMTQDEWDSEMQIALVKCIAYYNPNRGAAISTFCCKGMLFHATSVRRRISNRHKRAQIVSVDPAGIVMRGVADRSAAADAAGQEIYRGVMEEVARVQDGEMLLATLDGATRQQLADSRGFTKERARQLLERCKSQLRTSLRCQKLAADC